ncbi:MAG: high frequency lysogenization protein HflD, partial [Rhizobiales bacterium]|nr:high frequency lysogenization protein HflD [Hyphomicrobiales bacterium]
RELVAMILSIGIRPCSGAILVLVLAFALQQLAAGIAAVFAMSLGTGLSISALAALSVYARKGALALANAFETGGQWIARLADIAAVLGGLIIVAFGLALLSASFAVTSHPLL